MSSKKSSFFIDSRGKYKYLFSIQSAPINLKTFKSGKFVFDINDENNMHNSSFLDNSPHSNHCDR